MTDALCQMLTIKSGYGMYGNYLFSQCFYKSKTFLWVSLGAQMVKNLPAKWETWIQSLYWEDPLGKGMATHSSKTRS